MAEAQDAMDSENFVEIEVDNSLKFEWKDADRTTTVKENLEKLGATQVESIFDPNLQLVGAEQRRGRRGYGLQENGFMTAVRVAYAYHVPLSLSPDHIWTLISQGISKHIEKNAEEFRDLFVDFDGKQIIRLRRDNFVKGKQDNDWAGCFKDFSKEIAKFIGEDMKKKLCPNFTSTSDAARACHELGLMDCMKSYFDYRVMTRCGISKVKLEGSVEDWQKLEKSLEIMKELKLESWAEVLAPILNNFTRAAAGKDTDKYFWDTIYKAHLGGGSGSHPTVDGWSTNFFLYINDVIRQDKNFRPLKTLYEEVSAQQSGHRWHNPGVPQKAVPVGLSKTPFIWEYLSQEIDMYFYGGFVGAKYDKEEGYISPVLGWAVGEKPE